jgi:lysophospholipid acyltransferase (LPLAT)-like uncharacterized protein
MRYRHRSLDPGLDERHSRAVPPCIWAFWHENLLLPLYHYSQARLSVLISQHADGTFITGVCRQMGLRVVRGSTTRGGVEAVQELIRVARRSGLVITPDGPRGPRRRVQPGLAFLASRTELPIVPVGFGYQRAWRLKSWDRFALPVPGSLGTCICGAPIRIPPDINRRELEKHRQRVEAKLQHVTALAEAWAETERFPSQTMSSGQEPALKAASA